MPSKGFGVSVRSPTATRPFYSLSRWSGFMGDTAKATRFQMSGAVRALTRCVVCCPPSEMLLQSGTLEVPPTHRTRPQPSFGKTRPWVSPLAAATRVAMEECQERMVRDTVAFECGSQRTPTRTPCCATVERNTCVWCGSCWRSACAISLSF